MGPLLTAGLSSALDLGAGLLKGAIQTNQDKKAWERNNAYNHPVAQMQRLKEAGLNPHLVYGGGVSGATGMSSSPSKTGEYDVRSTFMDRQQQYVSMKNLEAVGKNLDKDFDLKTADINLKNAQAVLALSNSAKTDQEKQQAGDLFKDVQAKLRGEVENLGYTGQQIQKTTEKLTSDIERNAVLNGYTRQQVAESVQRVRQIEQTIINMRTDNEMKKVQTEILRLDRDLKKTGFSWSDPYYFRVGMKLLEAGSKTPVGVQLIDWFKSMFQ